MAVAFPFEDGELLSECNDFKRSSSARSKEHAQAREKRKEEMDHQRPL